MTEAERRLVLLAGRGDPEAFAALVAPKQPRLLALLVAAIGDWHEAEDALQEILWRAYLHLGHLRRPETFDVWLRQIAVNEARDRLRRAAARLGTEELFDAVDRGGAVDDLLVREGCQEILGAIAGLPRLQRRAANLAWVADVSPTEVAGVLGVSTASVHSALHRARRRLVLSGPATPRPGTVRVSGFDPFVKRLADHWTHVRPDLRVEGVDWQSPSADVRLGWLFWEAPLPLAPSPPPATELLPLDRLAETAGLNLDPFGPRILRHVWGNRPYWLPYYAAAEMIVYNASLLQQLGLPRPSPNWTWDEFFWYCRRAVAAGWIGCLPPPKGDVVSVVAEQLGATEDNLAPLGDALTFVRQWSGSGLSAAPPGPWCAGSFFGGRSLFLMSQASYAHLAFTFPGSRQFPWGVAPIPRMRREDPHHVFWYHSTLGIRGTASDPAAAFAVAAAAFTHGPRLRGAELPAYRTPEVMGAWRAETYPLGKECLLELEEATGPLYAPPNLYCLPGAKAVFDDLLAGSIDVTEAAVHLEQAVAARKAGAAPVFTDP